MNREAFLVQLFFGWTLTNETLLELVAGQRAGHTARLAAFEQIPVPALDKPDIDRMRALWRLTLELGVAVEQTYLDWLDTMVWPLLPIYQSSSGVARSCAKI